MGTAVPPEADTCRTWVVPGLRGAGWGGDQIAEQVFFTDGRIVVVGAREQRRKRKFADYLLNYKPDLPIAVVEAKAAYKRATDGLGQAKEYADILGLPFAYATNGPEIVEFDRLTGLTGPVAAYPSPDELWARRCAAEGLTAVAATPLLTPDYPTPGKPARYYQRIAINRAVQAIAGGKPRVLLTLATGTGKTTVAFQICWKLYQARWNRAGASRRPRMLFLADRSLLVEDPMTDDFAPFGDARSRINAGNVRQGRSMYFATYQALTGDETRERPLYERYPPDFFDLIVIDECHRGSARADSVWREILEWFHPAAQLGMTATPLPGRPADGGDGAVVLAADHAAAAAAGGGEGGGAGRGGGAERDAVRGGGGGADQGGAAGGVRPAHDRAAAERGVRAVHEHPDERAVLPAGGADAGGVVLRAAAAGGAEAVHEDGADRGRGVRAGAGVVGGAGGERAGVAGAGRRDSGVGVEPGPQEPAGGGGVRAHGAGATGGGYPGEGAADH